MFIFFVSLCPINIPAAYKQIDEHKPYIFWMNPNSMIENSNKPINTRIEFFFMAFCKNGVIA